VGKGTKLSELVMTELKSLDLPWHVDLDGRGHAKVFVAGRLAGVMHVSAGSGVNSRAALNVRAQIRRLVNELKAERGDESGLMNGGPVPPEAYKR
jgi:hypothetical protein